ncbi:MAG TPA: hypothetical protein VGB17_01320 [Pyrinomonadaceae bacterium]|jgi:hypothetical protein
MFGSNRTRQLLALSLLCLFGLSTSALAFQDQQKGKKDKATADGTPVLWTDPGDIATRDLFLGPGGDAMQPDLSSVTYLKDETGGYSTKYRVRDGAGREWVVKIGKEAQPETAVTRLVWAVGYQTDITYLVPHVEIQGKGAFDNVRFEARPEAVKRLDEWKWEDNPFVGSKELQGLKILMVLVNNWDLKNSNNRILLSTDEQTGRKELRYIVSDLGATFGKTGNFITHNRNQPKDYVKTGFIERIDGKRVRFDYHGKSGDLLRNISVEDARWIGELLSRLSDQQLKDAFRAANYSAEEGQLLADSVRERINELVNLPK